MPRRTKVSTSLAPLAVAAGIIFLLTVVSPLAGFIVGGLTFLGGFTLLKDGRRNPLTGCGAISAGSVLMIGSIIGFAMRAGTGLAPTEPNRSRQVADNQTVDNSLPIQEKATVKLDPNLGKKYLKDDAEDAPSQPELSPEITQVPEITQTLDVAQVPEVKLVESMRKWTNNTGKFSVVAQLLKIEHGSVTLQREDGKTVKVELSKLSQMDLEYVTSTSQKTDSKR